MGLGGNLSLLELRALRKELKEIQDYNDLLDQDIRTKKMNSIIEEVRERMMNGSRRKCKKYKSAKSAKST